LSKSLALLNKLGIFDYSQQLELRLSARLQVAENVAFSSPTAGAVIVNAGNVSGRIGSWRVEGTSKTYQDWHEEKLAKAGAAPAEVE
jgi:hypothetical protein